jgi:hypothetical protein
MDPNDLLERVRKTDASDAPAVARLAQDVAAEVHAAPTALVDIWGEGQTGPSENAAVAALRLEDLSLRPMLARWNAQRVDWRAQLMTCVVERAGDLRRRLWAQLGLQLDDTAVASTAPASRPAAEASRVCDEAYLWIRRLAGNAARTVDDFHEEREFLALPPAERNKEIQRWKQSKRWADMCETEPEAE